MKRILLIITALAMLICLAACNTPEDKPVNTQPAATEAPADKTADNATNPPATEVVTQAPTEVPATKEPGPGSDIDALLIDLEDDGNYTCFGSYAEINPGEPWLTIITEPAADNNFVAHFEEGAGFDSNEYPILAFKYRVGYGQSVRASNHLYAITSGGGPTPDGGWWYHLDYIADLDWHTVILDLNSTFPSAGNEWRSIRTPTADSGGGDLAYAWIGVFKTAEDAEKYDAAFTEKYGDKLVKAEAPKIEKQESVPDVADAFENVNIDFEDQDAGTTLAMTNQFLYTPGLNNSVFVDRDGGVAAQIEFDAFYYQDMVKSGTAYSASFDLKNTAGGLFGGFVFNWGDEGNTARNFFEDSGLVPSGGYVLVSASGCGFSFKGGNKVLIYFPAWDPAAVKISVASVEVEGPVDFDADYNRFRIDDDGVSKVSVYVNDQLFVTIEYSDPGFSDAPTLNEKYYRNVKVTSADGTELLTNENALFSIYKSFAFGGRAHKICVDNITIANK